jgi:hypothetical protein
MLEWHHLPMAGGLFDQDPVWLASVRLIDATMAKQEREDEKKKEMNKNFKDK